jgi:hypothetical protein
MTQGELEARVLDGERALASAPPDVSRELRRTAQAEANAWQESANAEIKHDQPESAGAKALARHMAAQREQLEAANARYEKWATDTSSRRKAAGKAKTELERRGLAQQTAEHRQAEPECEPQTIMEWSDSEADGQPSADDRAARLDGLLAQAAEAAQRFAAEKADREARTEYAAHLEREACTEPERTLQAEASYEAEIEL